MFPSHYEGGCSASIRETMVRGVPIVCSDAGGIPEVLSDGVHALMFRVGDVARLQQLLMQALADAAQLAPLVRAARTRIEEFSAERVSDDYLAALEAVAGRGTGASGS